MRCFPRWIAIVALAGCAFFPSLARANLTADQLLLITNKNDPDSGALAAEYAKLRQVPPEQIVALDLPDTDEIPFALYETGVVAPLRQYLKDRHLTVQVKCLVTFYGVPFRIADKINTLDEEDELDSIRHQLVVDVQQTQAAVLALEAQATQLDASFKPQPLNAQPDSSLEQTNAQFRQRIRAAIQTVASGIDGLSDPAAKTAATNALIQSIQTLSGLLQIDSTIGARHRANNDESASSSKFWDDVHAEALKGIGELTAARSARWDKNARAQFRQLAVKYLGLLGASEVMDSEIKYFETKQTGAATDSELALLWWDYYPRTQMQPNPLNYKSHQLSGGAPTLMVSRLDGPDPATVSRMMRDSVAVEAQGLVGQVALDARGMSPTHLTNPDGSPDALGAVDQKIRDLADELRQKTKLQVTLDNNPEVFPPHSVKNVALYCGWYSVNHYVPGCDFVRGAVGFHIASYEMVTLHDPNSRWVSGLLKDGVVATLGPVAEPYVGAFPDPTAFFPLLLTGKLTMAEVYWRTTPVASWMISFIGDPLYTPYRLHPALDFIDLPIDLQAALQPLN